MKIMRKVIFILYVLTSFIHFSEEQELSSMRNVRNKRSIGSSWLRNLQMANMKTKIDKIYDLIIKNGHLSSGMENSNCLQSRNRNELAILIGGSTGPIKEKIVEAYDWNKGFCNINLPALPEGREKITATVVENVIYVCGGIKSDGKPTNDCISLDPKKDIRWNKLAQRMSTNRFMSGMTQHNGKIYVVGGIENFPVGSAPTFDDMEIYDIQTQKWTKSTKMPNGGRRNVCALTYSGKIYVVGGWNGSKDVGTLEVYDPIKKSWERKADMNVPRNGGGCTIFENGILIAGAGRFVDNAFRGYPEAEYYDFASDTWTSIADMKFGTTDGQMTILNNHPITFAGKNNDGGYLDVVQYYNKSSNSWLLRSHKVVPPRDDYALVKIDSKLLPKCN